MVQCLHKRYTGLLTLDLQIAGEETISISSGYKTLRSSFAPQHLNSGEELVGAGRPKGELSDCHPTSPYVR